MEKLASAVIGCGRMGAFTSESVRQYAPKFYFPLSHAEAIKAHPRLELVAMCDSDAHNLHRAAEHYRIKRRYTDVLQMVDDVGPSLLGLATRTFGRADIIEAVVGRGVKAIHTEKPLCNSMSELNRLSEIFQQDDLFITWGAIRRFLGVYQQAVALAESGLYGNLLEVRVNMGSSALYWTHPHSIDLILFATRGRAVDKVQARLGDLENTLTRTRVENDPRVIAATIYFKDGVTGHITQAMGVDFVLSCENAEITVRADGHGLELYSPSEGAYPLVSPLPIQESKSLHGTLAPISQLVSCLDGNEDSIQSNSLLKRSILNAQLICFAMLQSHLECSKPVDLLSIDPDLEIMAKTFGRYA